MYAVFLGAPGAGKGTQAAAVAQELKLIHVATGDLFRQAVQKGTELGKQADSYMKQGKLVPDEVTIKVVLQRLAAPDCQAGVIFDGFPRTLEQAKALDKAMQSEGKKIDKVILINVAETELISRLGGRWICRQCQAPYHEVSAPPKVKGKCDKCGGELYQRADDKAETIKERLKVYATQTAPLIDYYKKAGKLTQVESVGEIKDITRRIVQALAKE